MQYQVPNQSNEAKNMWQRVSLPIFFQHRAVQSESHLVDSFQRSNLNLIKYLKKFTITYINNCALHTRNKCFNKNH